MEGKALVHMRRQHNSTPTVDLRSPFGQQFVTRLPQYTYSSEQYNPTHVNDEANANPELRARTSSRDYQDDTHASLIV